MTSLETPAAHVASVMHVFEKIPRRHRFKVIRIDFDLFGGQIAQTQVGEIRGARDGGGLLFTAYTMDNTPLGSGRVVFPLRGLFEKRLRGFRQGAQGGFLERNGKVASHPDRQTYTFYWTITGTTEIQAGDRKAAERKFDRMNRAAMLEHPKTSTEFNLQGVHDPEVVPLAG